MELPTPEFKDMKAMKEFASYWKRYQQYLDKDYSERQAEDERQREITQRDRRVVQQRNQTRLYEWYLSTPWWRQPFTRKPLLESVPSSHFWEFGWVCREEATIDGFLVWLAEHGQQADTKRPRKAQRGGK